MLLWKVPDSESVGRHAAARLADRIRQAHARRGEATTVILAAAPSQKPTLRRLLEFDLPWSEITVGHMDEYIWPKEPGPQSFVNWLQTHFVREAQQRWGLKKWIPIDGKVDPLLECRRLNALFAEGIDVLANGIGVNGHCGFEDPGADLLTDEIFRVRTMDLACRMQQVDPGDPFLFPDLGSVPCRAITLTIPAAMHARSIVASVLGESKAPAVRDLFEAGMSNRYPLMCACRWHQDAVMVADAAATSHMMLDRQIPFYNG